jgi:hypothetical protein
VRVVRSLIGFVLAAVAAGITQVAFVITPFEIVGGSWDRASAAGLLLLLATAHNLAFAAPLAALGTLALRWRGAGRSSILGVIRYPAIGVAMALIAALFLLIRDGGSMAAGTGYAVTALASSGAVGGLVYWLLAGRRRKTETA